MKKKEKKKDDTFFCPVSQSIEFLANTVKK